VHLFRPTLGFLVEAEPRLENRRGQKALFGRGAHNVFRVRLGKNFEKHELIVNFEVIFDTSQVRYTEWLRKLDSLFHICPKDGTTRKNEMGIADNIGLFYVTMLSKNEAKCWF
jgi:hypothetical protein